MREIIFKIIFWYVIVHMIGYSKGKDSNPYFYDVQQVSLVASAEYYNLEILEQNTVDIAIYMVKAYEQGKLYKFEIEPLAYLSEERTNIYFYVTSDKIYRIWSYIYQNGEIVEFYNDDELIVEYLNTDERLIQNGEIVCQLEETTTRTEEGVNRSILLTENQVTYSRYDEQINGEIGFYEWFTWEKDKGLVNYGSGFGAEADVLYLNNIEIIYQE